MDVGGGPEKNPEGGSGVEGIGGSGGVEEGGKGSGRGVVGKGDSGEAASGGVGSVHGGVGQTHRGESDIVARWRGRGYRRGVHPRIVTGKGGVSLFYSCEK